MLGISSNGKEEIGKAIEDIFDKISLQFIGDIPKLKYKKMLLIGNKESIGLPNLFVQAMKNKTPNPIEQDALKSLLDSAHGYIESLKNKTKSNVTERIDAIVKESKARHTKVTEEEIQEVLSDEMRKARSHLLAIVESESTKLRNVGTMMDISRIAASAGDQDPTVFFVVVKDASTCKECIKLHLMEDGITPRLWKFSELKQGYHKRGEVEASAYGLHPYCRCTLTYLSNGFGFKNGIMSYIGPNYDAYSKQKRIDPTDLLA